MFVTVIKTKEQLENEEPVVTHESDGTLTRAGALIEARKLHGELGMISYSDTFPIYLVWKIGEFNTTIGRGRTWERALKHSAERSTKR